MSLESLLLPDITAAIETVRSMTYTVLSSVSNEKSADALSIPSRLFFARDQETKIAEKHGDALELIPKVADLTPPPYESDPAYARSSTPLPIDSDDEYWSVTPIEDVESETMTTQEAEVELKDIQYASTLGSLTELDYTERKRFAVWCTFNSALRELFHRMHAITSEVDYGRMF